MAKRVVNESNLTSVAEAIRDKSGTTSPLAFPEGFISAIRSITPGEGGITPNGTINISTNGIHDVTSFASANVNVPTSGGGNVGDDIEVGSLSELHAWSKYTIGGTIIEEPVTDVQLFWKLASSSDVFEIDYADSYEIVDDVISLVNPTTITLGSDTESRNAIRGKYVKRGYVYYIPSDARVAYGNYTTNKTIEVDKATKITYIGADGEFVGIVVSEDSNAYPQNGEQDGYKYVYNGTLDSAGGCDHAEVTQAKPVLTVSESGLITVTSTQEAGLVSGGTNTVTHQLPTQSAVAVKPGATSKTAVAAGKYTIGDVIVMGDPDLVADNIRSGVDIFGVFGTYGGNGSVDTSDATLVAEQDLLSGVVAYGKDGKRVVGTAKDSRAWYGTYSAEPENYTSGEAKYVMLKLKPSEPTMVRDTVELCARVSKFGDASAGDVVKGKTFTSKDGLKVTGTIEEYGDDGNSYGWEGAMPYTTEQGIGLSGTARSDMLFRKGCKFTLTTQPSNFGDATAADVAKGKTFTSVEGLKVIGTNPFRDIKTITIKEV